MILVVDGTNIFHTMKHQYKVKPDFIKLYKQLCPNGATHSEIHITLPPSNKNPNALRGILRRTYNAIRLTMVDPDVPPQERPVDLVEQACQSILQLSVDFPHAPFTLVTGDNKFLPTLMELQRRGHHVTLAAPLVGCSRALISVADEFVDLTDTIALEPKPAKAA